MIFRALDSNGDWTFGTGKQSYLTGLAAIAANIKTREMLILGECFWDTSAGVDWWRYTGAKGAYVLPSLLLQIRNVLANSYGVTAIREATVSLENRRFVCTWSVDSIYSRTVSGKLTRPI